MIKGAVQRVDNRGYVCPSGKTTRVAVKGFFVRNHFKIAFSKVSRVSSSNPYREARIILGPTIRAAKNGEKFLTSGPIQNLPCLEKDETDIRIRPKPLLRFTPLMWGHPVTRATFRGAPVSSGLLMSPVKSPESSRPRAPVG